MKTAREMIEERVNQLLDLREEFIKRGDSKHALECIEIIADMEYNYHIEIIENA